MGQPDFDVLVIGGGPAGAVTAVRMQALGLDVVLVARPRQRPALEGLAPRTIEALNTLGFARAAVCSTAPLERQVYWNGTHSAANSEVLVERRDFDAALLMCVREAGVKVVDGVVERKKYEEGEWTVQSREREGVKNTRVRMIVEARGRRGLPGAESELRGPPTFSLARWYEGAKPAQGFTAIASHLDGWCWLAAPGDGRLCVQAITQLDEDHCQSRDRLKDLHRGIVRDLLAQTHGILGQVLRPQCDLFVRPARVALSTTPVTRHMIRVGDAAASVDPLSGHGIFQALSSGLAAAPTVNTVLNRPAQSQLAMAFYASRVKSRFMHQVEAGQDFYGQEARWSHRPFWRERRAWLSTEEADGGVPRADAPGALYVRRQAVVDAGFVVERDVLVAPGHSEGVFLLGGVPMAALWREMRKSAAPCSEEDLARLFEVSPQRISHALHWLRAQSQET